MEPRISSHADPPNSGSEARDASLKELLGLGAVETMGWVMTKVKLLRGAGLQPQVGDLTRAPEITTNLSGYWCWKHRPLLAVCGAEARGTGWERAPTWLPMQKL